MDIRLQTLMREVTLMKAEVVGTEPERSEHLGTARIREFVYGKHPFGEREFSHLLGCPECLAAVNQFKQECTAANS